MAFAYLYLETSIMIYLNKKHHNPWIDYLKAFAIYLVIVGHMMTNCMNKWAELKVTDNKF